jgi:hypothetical protein
MAMALNLKLTQADHHDRMAKLSDAYASAYESDIGSAQTGPKQNYLKRRARQHRKEAELRRTKAFDLRLASRDA